MKGVTKVFQKLKRAAQKLTKKPSKIQGTKNSSVSPNLQTPTSCGQPSYHFSSVPPNIEFSPPTMFLSSREGRLVATQTSSKSPEVRIYARVLSRDPSVVSWEWIMMPQNSGRWPKYILIGLDEAGLPKSLTLGIETTLT